MYKRMGPKSHKQYVKEGEANPSSYTIKEETDPHLFFLEEYVLDQEES